MALPALCHVDFKFKPRYSRAIKTKSVVAKKTTPKYYAITLRVNEAAQQSIVLVLSVRESVCVSVCRCIHHRLV